MEFKSSSQRVLSVFSLVMINVIAIDSLRNLPANAQMGLSVVFYYCLAAIFFLLPCVLITAELATHFPKTGGAYVWVKKAFGARMGFVNIWLQWVYNVIWYPTILSFIAANIAYLIDPSLANNKLFMLPLVISMFTIATLANCFGMKVSSLMSAISAILGTLLPMLFIISLAAAWLLQGKPLAITPTLDHFIPTGLNTHVVGYIVVILFSLMGMEMSAVHAEEVKNPVKHFPRALLISSVIILLTLVAASMAIAMIVPQNTLNLLSGLDQAFSAFLTAFHLSWILPIAVLLIIVGAFGGMAAWVIGPTKGLMIAAEDNCGPKIFASRSKNNVPVPVLLLQWGMVITLCFLFLCFNEIKTWYWILSDLTAQLALLFYVILFAAAIKLRYITPERTDGFRIPGGKVGIWIVGLTGIVTALVGIVFGFFPPSDLGNLSTTHFEMILMAGILLFCLLPVCLTRRSSSD